MSDPDAEVRSGRALLAEGQVGPAAEAFQRALAVDAARVDALLGMAAVLVSLQRLPDAEPYARQALAVSPHDPDAVRTLSGLLQMQGRHADALAIAEAVTAARPDLGEGWMARGDSLANLGRSEEALECFRAALRSGDVAFQALVQIGMVLGATGRPAKAIEALDAALTLEPDAAVPRFQRGVLRLSLKDFGQGWDDYEARWRSDRFVASSRGVLPKPMVPMLSTGASAADLRGKRVLLVGEQGVGDEIMFASIIPDLARAAASVACVCEPRLVGLFAASFETVSVVSPKTAKVDTDAIDVILTLGSLGAAFRRDTADFPGTPYLRPRAQVVERWAERLGPRTARHRVGLSWRGGLPMTRRDARSLPLEALSPILGMADCEFVSLQYGDVMAEVAAFNAGRAAPIRVFDGAEIDDFEDLAGLAANLDAVVSVQTALVHLCGAIGLPCLTFVPDTPVWRYGVSGSTMPWYRSVRLFRQAQRDAWEPVVAEAAAALRDRLSSPG